MGGGSPYAVNVGAMSYWGIGGVAVLGCAAVGSLVGRVGGLGTTYVGFLVAGGALGIASLVLTLFSLRQVKDGGEVMGLPLGTGSFCYLVGIAMSSNSAQLFDDLSVIGVFLAKGLAAAVAILADMGITVGIPRLLLRHIERRGA